MPDRHTIRIAPDMEGEYGSVPEGTYVELVRSLFVTLLPAAIMSVSFVGIGAYLSARTHDALLLTLTCLGGAAGIARLTVLIAHRQLATAERLTMVRARKIERRFALSYLAFAIILGAFGARAFIVAAPDCRMLVIELLSGYGAGVAAGLSLRPWISVPSILVAVAPTALAAFTTSSDANWAAGALLAVFLGGGIESMIGRYRSETKKITMRRMFSSLARHDELTRLPNRLSLRERFEKCSGFGHADGEPRVAVHCLDLDRFKPVNDRYGHPVGDALLRAVANRLEQSLRDTDFVARVGGDEFVVVQCAVRHEGEAEMLARRLVRLISEPFLIHGHAISIGTSVGYIVSADTDNDIDRLVACADQALCRVKREGRGAAAYCEADGTEYRKVA